MVTVPHNSNIQRIIDVLLNDTAVFDSGETVGKARQILFGDQPNNEKLTANMKPYIYVSTPELLQETSPEIGVSNPDNVKSVTVEYSVVIVADSRAKTESSQRQLYDLVTNVRNTLEANPTFKEPVTDDDPIFVRSIISDVSWDSSSKGQLTTSITMTILATIGSLFFLEIPGITDPIPLISKPIDRDTDEIENILDDTLIRKDVSPIRSIRTIFTEFESSAAILSSLRTIKDSRDSNSYTITSPTGIEVIIAYLTEIASSTGFSTMETTVIQLDVINP